MSDEGSNNLNNSALDAEFKKDLEKYETATNNFIETFTGEIGSTKGNFVSSYVKDKTDEILDEMRDNELGKKAKLFGKELLDNFKEYMKEYYFDYVVWIGYALLILINIRFIYLLASMFRFVDTKILNITPWTFFSVFEYSASLWLFSTSRIYWNYYNRKFFGLYLVITTILLRLAGSVYYLFYNIFIPHVAKLQVTELMTETKIAGLAWLSTIVPTVIITIMAASKLYGSLSLPENVLAIRKFKIIHYIGKSYSKYEYTMQAVRYMKDGGKVVIGLIDRMLHTNIVGATGTAKTSSVMLPMVNDDLNTKILNEDKQKKEVKKLIKKGKAYIIYPFDDREYSTGVYNKGYIRPAPGYEEVFEKKVLKYKSAGMTIIGPDPSLPDDVFALCELKQIPCNRIDPVRDDNGVEKKGSKGFNTLYISPLIEDWAIRKEMVKKATLVADVMQTMFEMGGKSDPYFSSVNRIATTTLCMVVMMVHSRVYPQQTPNLKYVQRIINNFNLLNNYKLELGKYNQEHGMAYQAIVDVVNNLFTYSNEEGAKRAAKFEEHCSGLKVQFNNFLLHPDIERILCAEETIDMDQMLRDGEVTVVNIELGDLGPVNSPCFGLFFTVSFINAVLRRKGNEMTRLEHFLDVDELPIILNPAMESCYTLFRKFKCAMTGAVQTLDQMDKNPFLRYMKGVVLSNCSHHIVFGRGTINDTETFSKMAGMKEKQTYQESYTKNALSSTNPTYSERSEYKTEVVDMLSANDMRYKDFQEVTCFTVQDGRALEPFEGRVNFLRKMDKRKKRRYRIDWEKLYNEQPYKPSDVEIAIVNDEAAVSGEKVNLYSNSKAEASILHNNNEEVHASIMVKRDAAAAGEVLPEEGKNIESSEETGEQDSLEKQTTGAVNNETQEAKKIMGNERVVEQKDGQIQLITSRITGHPDVDSVEDIMEREGYSEDSNSDAGILPGKAFNRRV